VIDQRTFHDVQDDLDSLPRFQVERPVDQHARADRRVIDRLHQLQVVQLLLDPAAQRRRLADVQHLHPQAEPAGEEIDRGVIRQEIQVEALVKSRHRDRQPDRRMPRHGESHSAAILFGSLRRDSFDKTCFASFRFEARSAGSGAWYKSIHSDATITLAVLCSSPDTAFLSGRM
jgi:hypothetical protein